MEIRFYVSGYEERAAGIIQGEDVVTVIIESGDPGGDDGEFAAYMREALEEWFGGGPKVSVETKPQDGFYARLAALRARVAELERERDELRLWRCTVDNLHESNAEFQIQLHKERDEAIAKAKQAERQTKRIAKIAYAEGYANGQQGKEDDWEESYAAAALRGGE